MENIDTEEILECLERISGKRLEDPRKDHKGIMPLPS